MIIHKGISFVNSLLDRLFVKIIYLRDKEVDESFIRSLKKYNKKSRILLNIPVEKCRTQIWNTLEVKKNPFVQTLVDYKKTGTSDYKSSPLKEYYHKYQPKNASEVLRIEHNTILENLPSYGYVFPWDTLSVERTIEKRNSVALYENKRNGYKEGLSLGYTDFGPISFQKGEIEINRLVNIYNAIDRNSYKEKVYYRDGGIKGYFLIDDNNWCFIIKSGKHRAYALSAQEATSIPVILDIDRGVVKSKEDIPNWKHVRNGIFSEKDAMIFMNKVINLPNES